MAIADDEDFAGEPEVAAPSVVAVVVSCDPGPWFEECLSALANQDYPHLSILVIDNGDTDVTPRVATAAPNAFVRRLSSNTGFATAANEVLTVVDGASHYVICHDDVAPEPDAIRLLLEEAFRSNAAVVGPKLVDWDDPTRLLQVGLNADKGGVTSGPVERGELDQEQHDAVRDVFCVPGGLTLVRADLFATVGGFDPAIAFMGEDLDLCWRAQIAGGRVLIAPAARVRHVEALARDLRPGHESGPGQLRAIRARHRVRAVLKNYSLFHLLRVVPQLLTVDTGEAAYLFGTGRRSAARNVVRAWWANLRNLGDLRAARRAVRAYRVWPDAEVRRLQARGSARLTRFVRARIGRREQRALLEAPHWAERLRPGRLPLAASSVIALVLVIGSRHLLTGAVPAVGHFAPLPSIGHMLRVFLSGWRTTGVGSPGPAPPAFGILGLAGSVLFGNVSLLQRLLVLGAFPVGLVGIYRLARPLDSVPARVLALIVYAAIPVPYNALARGGWGGLVAYALAPWLLAALAKATRTAPFADDADDEPTRDRRGAVRVVALGIALAATAALAPALLPVTIVVAVGMELGGLLAAETSAARSLRTAVLAVAVAVVLLAPWSLDLLVPGHGLSRLMAPAMDPAHAPGLGRLIRFQTGPLGAGPIGWLFLIPAALPLVVGHDWRLRWGARCWGVALTTWLFVWAAGRGWLGPLPAPAPEIALAFTAAALAFAAGLGLVAFQTDLPAYRFGWRQLASTVAAAAVALGTIPVITALGDGRWHLPGTDYRGQLSWMPDHLREGAFRVLWVGGADTLPLEGWRVADGIAYGLSDGGPPDAVDLWPATDNGATHRVATAVNAARRERTTRLGRDLAPAAVRYIVVTRRAAPTGHSAPSDAPVDGVIRGLAAQLDLKLLNEDGDRVVYENAAWGPGRARLAAVSAATDGIKDAFFTGAVAALPAQPSLLHFSGHLDRGDSVFFSEASSPRWTLRVAGANGHRSRALGWAMKFTVPRSGKASLRYRTPPSRYAVVLIEAALWVVAVRYLVRHRRRRRAT